MDKGERAFYIFLTILLLTISYFAFAGILYLFCWAFEWNIWSWRFAFIMWVVWYISKWLLRLGDHKSDE